MTTPRPLAVVTGASSGIGRDLADLLAGGGHDLVLIARRQERLDELGAELSAAHGIECRSLVADLATPDECERCVAFLAPDAARLRVLVNNAGFGTHGFFHEIPVARDRAMIDVNCSAMVHLTKRILPWMRANGAGRILNMASVSAFQPGPLMAVYYASKAFVLSLSEALSNECEGTGVTVTVSCPGPTVTEFTRVAGIRPGARTSGAPPMTSIDVARLSYEAMMKGKRVEITGTRNKIVIFFSRFLPQSYVLSTVRAIQEKRRPARAPAKP
jgi:short-subunit dehydrogenase